MDTKWVHWTIPNLVSDHSDKINMTWHFTCNMMWILIVPTQQCLGDVFQICLCLTECGEDYTRSKSQPTKISEVYSWCDIRYIQTWLLYNDQPSWVCNKNTSVQFLIFFSKQPAFITWLQTDWKIMWFHELLLLLWCKMFILSVWPNF